MKRVEELKRKRAKLIEDARALVSASKTDTLSSEDEARYNTMFADIDKLGAEIKREEDLIEEERALADAYDKAADSTPGGSGGKKETPEEERKLIIMDQFRGFLRSGRLDAEFVSDCEQRALSVGLDTEGGVLMPHEFVGNLIQAIDDMVFIQRRATNHNIQGFGSLGAPSLDNDPADADWTTELATGSEDSTMSFGKRKLTPSPIAKRIKVSTDLLRGVPSVEALIMARLAYKFGITREKAFLTGSGSGQPLGVFTAHANGISTDRDVSTGNAATSMKFDGLIEAKYSVKEGYHRNASWIFHRDGVKQLVKLKDGEGQYIWRTSVDVGRPDTLMGAPVDMSEYAPNTYTSGLYAGMYGDFSYYWIVNSMSMVIQRLNELYAETNQVGFIGRDAADGMPVLEEAFARVKLG